MKLKSFIGLALIFLLINGCKKPDKQEKFASTTYERLGAFDSSGKPNYLLPPDDLSPSLLSYLNNMLRNGQDVSTSHPELLSSVAIADIPIKEPSDVFVTFVSQDGGYTNSLAFYTYPTKQPLKSDKDIQTITYIFPNSGIHTPLKPGDKVKIGRFEPGTSIGFVILQQGWDTLTKTLDSKVVHFCTNDILNPEADPKLKKHAVLINYPAENKLLIGFEDLLRTNPICDNDFNDVIFYCTVTP